MPNWHRRPWIRVATFAGVCCIERTIPESPVAFQKITGKRFPSGSVSVVPGAGAEAPVSPCVSLDARYMLA